MYLSLACIKLKIGTINKGVKGAPVLLKIQNYATTLFSHTL